MKLTDYLPRFHIPALMGPTVKASLGRVLGVGDAIGGASAFSPEVYGEYYHRSTWAYSAIKLRADSVGSARMIVMQRGPDGKLTPVPDSHELQQMFDYVNPWWTRSDLWRATETYLSLWGKAFWYIETDLSGKKSIWPLRPDRTKVVPGPGNSPVKYIKGYLYEHGGRSTAFEPNEIVWFRYFNPLDEFEGHSPVAAARQSLDMGADAVRFNRYFFKNAATPQDVIFRTEHQITDDLYDEFMERLEARHRSPDKAHRPMLLGDGMDAKRLGMNQRDMEFLATLNFTVQEAARVWRVWPQMLMSEEGTTFTNVSEAIQDFWMATISSEWAFLEAEVNELLIPALGAADDLVVAFDTANVPAIQRILAQEDDRALKRVEKGAMTINEYREERGLPAVLWGDVWWAQNNLVPIEDDTPPEVPGLAPAAAPGEAALTLGHPGTRRSLRPRHPREDPTFSEAFEKALSTREQQFKTMQRSLFDDQRRNVLHRLEVMQNRTFKTKAIREKAMADELFDPTEWTEVYTKTGTPVFKNAVDGAGRSAASRFRLPPFDPNDPAVGAWIKERTAWWAGRVNEETAKLLAQEITAAAQAGESIPLIQARVEKVFRFADAVRSERIARTEMIAASNEGHLIEYAQSKMVDEKEWLTSLDGRERDDHREANGQKVPLGTPFMVGGEKLDGPGLGHRPENNVNCRCVAIPVIREPITN